MHSQVHDLHSHLSDMLEDVLHRPVPESHVDDLFTKLHAVAHQTHSESPSHEDNQDADIEIGDSDGSVSFARRSTASKKYGGDEEEEPGDEGGSTKAETGSSSEGTKVLKLKLKDDLEPGSYDIDFGNGKKHLQMKINKVVPASSYDMVQSGASSSSDSGESESSPEEESNEPSGGGGYGGDYGGDEEGESADENAQHSHTHGHSKNQRHHGTHGHHGGAGADAEGEEVAEHGKSKGKESAPDDAIHEAMHVGGLRLSKADPKEKILKLVESVKMLVRLGAALRPVEKRLTEALKGMPPKAASNAKVMLAHVQALRGYSGKVVGLMKALKSKDMTREERKTAVVNLVHGLHEIQVGIKDHIKALVLMKSGHKVQGVDLAGIAGMPRMLTLLQHMHATVEKELADPTTKDLPRTALDLKVYETMKETVVKIEALVVAAGKSLQNAKTEEERARTQVAVQMAIKELTDDMKAKFKGYQREAADLKESLIEKKAETSSPTTQPAAK